MRSPFRPPERSPPVVLERIRPVEVPVLTELKRRLGREDLAGAVLFAYPKVVGDLARGFGVEIPPGYSHEEILGRCFTVEMAPYREFFDRLYRIYEPVRFGGRSPPAGPEELFEIVQSLYSAEPMWRLYVSEPLPAPAESLGAPTARPEGSAP